MEDPSERQLVAYNARDIDGFAACYTEDVVAEDALGTRLFAGRDALRERYGAMFAKYPDLHCEVVTRIHVGEYILHEERVTGRQPTPEHVVAAYHVASGFIRHVRFFR